MDTRELLSNFILLVAVQISRPQPDNPLPFPFLMSLCLFTKFESFAAVF